MCEGGDAQQTTGVYVWGGGCATDYRCVCEGGIHNRLQVCMCGGGMRNRLQVCVCGRGAQQNRGVCGGGGGGVQQNTGVCVGGGGCATEWGVGGPQ